MERTNQTTRRLRPAVSLRYVRRARIDVRPGGHEHGDPRRLSLRRSYAINSRPTAKRSLAVTNTTPFGLYNAGADFVLSLSAVTGNLLASPLLDHDEMLTAQTELEFARTEAPALAGQTLEEVGSLTDWLSGRGGRAGRRTVAEPGADFGKQDDDVVVVSGSDDATERPSSLSIDTDTPLSSLA
ncbi:hypothetical protein CYV19_12130 [Natronobacterium gregoryi SP2]|uniref:TrkA-N domain-containing protein n=1 Tax=Natronobacterium gregoryi (strain ATCC 43098 / DSM 3393 / CCM 3738 / CIP 104747 / IAM 13177 / JCM 8860 / NBRC 102187 / NCIMB 2189 / SP2) TaxID=797304 RepID=L9Y1K2_NATGS|nr:TrkA-N domain-containing protein [Natronobacterium gregoryi SP2]PLK19950.1 hypothetical protein CYV19_12130 [Natronobacterium gregoryi SP2]